MKDRQKKVSAESVYQIGKSKTKSLLSFHWKGVKKWYAHIPSLAGINRCSLLGEEFDKIEKNIYTSYPEFPMGPKERLAWKVCGQAQRFWAPPNQPFLPTQTQGALTVTLAESAMLFHCLSVSYSGETVPVSAACSCSHLPQHNNKGHMLQTYS